MRRPPLDMGMIGRIAGFLAVVAAIAATAVHFRHDDPSPPASAKATTSAPGDPLSSKLRRCQAIGMAAKDDAACEAAWAENRRRFFTYRRPSDHSMPTPAINPTDATPKLEGK